MSSEEGPKTGDHCGRGLPGSPGCQGGRCVLECWSLHHQACRPIHKPSDCVTSCERAVLGWLGQLAPAPAEVLRPAVVAGHVRAVWLWLSASVLDAGQFGGDPVPCHHPGHPGIIWSARPAVLAVLFVHHADATIKRMAGWMDGPGTRGTGDGQFHTGLLLTAEIPVSFAINSADIVCGKSISQYKNYLQITHPFSAWCRE